MKRIKSHRIALVAVAMMVGIMLSTWGCMNNAPFSPESQGVSNQSSLHLISLDQGNLSLSKGDDNGNHASAWVTQKKGGKLRLDYKTNDTKVVIKLKVFPHTISRDAELMVSLGTRALDMTFTPEGINFSKPAMLDIKAKGLDLSNVALDKIDIYYFNPETNEWERTVRKAVKVRPKKGIIEIIDAEIPHFSRYAVAWGE